MDPELKSMPNPSPSSGGEWPEMPRSRIDSGSERASPHHTRSAAPTLPAQATAAPATLEAPSNAGKRNAADASPPPAPFSAPQILFFGAGNFGAGLLFAFTNAALPLYLASYRLPNAAIGLLSQERPPLAGVLQLVVGALSDRTRTRLG